MANETIRKFVGFLNNESKDGGYWLPNIQRQFVWKEEQIEKLYDSILREYPIGSLLVWRTEAEIKARSFIQIYSKDLKITQFFRPTNDKEKHLVLDGQQRLQSLFIGLKGSYAKKELYLDILSGDLVTPEDSKFGFTFLDSSTAKFPFLKFKDLVFSDKKVRELKEAILDKIEDTLTDEQTNRIEDNLETIKHVFATKEAIHYQIVDSIDRPKTYQQDDIVEIFIRANSGGTTLSKSDLLFSLLTANWEESEENLVDILEKLNKTGYKFGRDFILKTCLVLLNTGAKYQIEKFRRPEIRDGIIEDWENISAAILDVKDFVYGKTFLHTDKTMPSYLVLIPLIYMRYHYKETWLDYEKDYKQYLLRSSLSGVFGGQPDNLINKIINHIKDKKNFNISEIFGIVREDNRALEISKRNLLALHYASKEIHLLFNLWYGFNYQPSFADNKPQVDHIFPKSRLKKVKVPNPETGKLNIMKYKWYERNQIANLMLLTAVENGAANKSDQTPEDWFADKSEDYLDKHLIPKEKELWKMDNYEQFCEKRKELIINKFEHILVTESKKLNDQS